MGTKLAVEPGAEAVISAEFVRHLDSVRTYLGHPIRPGYDVAARIDDATIVRGTARTYDEGRAAWTVVARVVIALATDEHPHEHVDSEQWAEITTHADRWRVELCHCGARAYTERESART